MVRSHLTRRALLRRTGAALAFGVATDGALAAPRKQARKPPSRGALETLWSNRTYYVRPDGDDHSPGLRDARSDAFRTWQAGYDRIAESLNFNGRTVYLRAGGTGVRTFTAPTSLGVLETYRTWQGGGSLRIIGDPAAPENVVFSVTDAPCIRLRNDLTGKVVIEGFTLRAPGNWGIRHGARGDASVGNLIFDTCSVHIGVEALAAYMDTVGPHTIVGDAERHIDCDSGFMYFRHRVSLIGERAFRSFVRARNGGRLISDMTFDVQGTVRGMRYEAREVSLINTQGRGFEYFPGNEDGIASTGGAYIP